MGCECGETVSSNKAEGHAVQILRKTVQFLLDQPGKREWRASFLLSVFSLGFFVFFTHQAKPRGRIARIVARLNRFHLALVMIEVEGSSPDKTEGSGPVTVHVGSMLLAKDTKVGQDLFYIFFKIFP
jgi:hypothetical protein